MTASSFSSPASIYSRLAQLQSLAPSAPPTEAPHCGVFVLLCLALAFLLVLRRSSLPLTPDLCGFSSFAMSDVEHHLYCMLLDCVSSFRGQAIPGPAMPTRCCLHQVLRQHPGDAGMAIILAMFKDVRAAACYQVSQQVRQYCKTIDHDVPHGRCAKQPVRSAKIVRGSL